MSESEKLTGDFEVENQVFRTKFYLEPEDCPGVLEIFEVVYYIDRNLLIIEKPRNKYFSGLTFVVSDFVKNKQEFISLLLEKHSDNYPELRDALRSLCAILHHVTSTQEDEGY